MFLFFSQAILIIKSKIVSDTKLFDIGEIISAPIVTLINFNVSTHQSVDWRVMTSSVHVPYLAFHPLHHIRLFVFELVSYKKISSH